MNKYKHKIKSILNERKNIYVFLIVLLFVGIIFGSLFTTILDEHDKTIVIEHIKSFFVSIDNISYDNTLKSSLISNIFSIIFIWIMGASGIGIVLIPVFIFIKGFILGFSIGSIVFTYGFKGILIAFVYIFPHDIITILALFILSLKSFNLSLSFLKNLFSKKAIDYRLFGKKYLKLLVITLIICIISSLLEAFLSPILLSSIKSLF